MIGIDSLGRSSEDVSPEPTPTPTSSPSPRPRRGAGPGTEASPAEITDEALPR